MLISIEKYFNAKESKIPHLIFLGELTNIFFHVEGNQF